MQVLGVDCMHKELRDLLISFVNYAMPSVKDIHNQGFHRESLDIVYLSIISFVNYAMPSVKDIHNQGFHSLFFTNTVLPDVSNTLGLHGFLFSRL